MKNLILLLFMSFYMAINAQIEDVRFTTFTYLEPQHYVNIGDWEGDGFNIGFGLEYQSNIVYAKATTFAFPELNDISYFDVGGAFGFNYQSQMRFWRIYTGFVGGRIWRNGVGDYSYMGGELGLDYYLNGWNNGLFIGLQTSLTSSTDSKYYSNDDTITRWNLGLKIGISF